MVEAKEKKQKVKIFRPQEGFQEQFLVSKADIVIGGGSAGGGKTFVLLMDALYDIDNPKFGYTYFRRNLTQIKKQGGLWDASLDLYTGIRPSPNPKVSELKWEFPSGANISFNHLEYEKDIHSWQGTELPAIGFDELTHFSFKMFSYLMSRNRSTSGVKPRIRATCNPDPDSWVAKFIDWWIGEDGFPMPERSGRLRYFIANGNRVDDFIWGRSKNEVIGKAQHVLDRVMRANDDNNVKPEDLIKSVTFIPGSVYDNKALLKIDPGYLGNLASQDEATRAHLLEGNWKFRTKGEEMVTMEVIDDMFSRYPQTNGRRCISVDVAGKGTDKLVALVWDGFHLIDISVVSKSDGKQIVDSILRLMRTYHIIENDIVFDADGVGSHIDGYISGAHEFKNNATPINGENYRNLKSQCAVKWANRLKGKIIGNDNGLNYSIDRMLSNRKFDKKTLREHINLERKAIRLDPSSDDGKIGIIKKSEMKSIIGHSPDFVESMLMLEYLYLDTQTYNGNLIW